MPSNESKPKRVLRFFVSSVGRLMNEERETLRELIWKSGNLPIAMEGFWGNHDKTSLQVVIENLQKADVVIIVLGYTYGSVIGKVNQCSKCPINGTCPEKKSKKKSCTISYTHFEYLYALQEKIRRYCIVQENINDIEGLQSRAASLGVDGEEKKALTNDYITTQSKQLNLVNFAKNNWTASYDANNGSKKISERFNEIFAGIRSDISEDDSELYGLVDGRMVMEKMQVINQEKEALRKELEEAERCYRQIVLRSKTPITAVTGTCIPFKREDKDTIITYLILNSAYTNGDRLMFPGGHAFVNDEAPEDIAITKAKIEAGLVVKPIDLYHNFDVLPIKENDSFVGCQFSPEFSVYRPPHYSYLFTQNENAKCYHEKNHHYHYDAVYVCEISEVLSEDKCAQKRVKIELPNKIPTFIATQKYINDSLKELRFCDDTHGDYVTKMLFEAYRDYVNYLVEADKHA